MMSTQVLSGITFTKLIGMSVLALTRSKLLEVSRWNFFRKPIADGTRWPIDVLFPDVVDFDHLWGPARTGLTPRRVESSRRCGIPNAGD